MPTTTLARKPAPKAPRKKPAARSTPEKLNGIGTDAVERATGKGWAEWLKVLDRDGAADLSHKEIARLLHDKHGVPAWWSQMVTVGYEQGRGLRQKHQMADGFRISASKTVKASLAALYRAWADPVRRERWLPGANLTIRTAIANKSMRITWEPGSPKPTSLVVACYAKGEGKSQVTLEHGKLGSAAAGEKAKRFWTSRLPALADALQD